MSAHRLHYLQVASLLRDMKLGMTQKDLVKKYKITRGALHYWMPYVGLDAEWLPYVKLLKFKFKWLERRYLRTKEQLRVSAAVMKTLIPSRKRRSLMSATVRAKYGLDRKAGNSIFGLVHSAGGSAVKTKNADDELVSAMKGYLAENPGSGFDRMFNAVLSHKSYVKNRVLQLYKDNKLSVKNRKTKVVVPPRVSTPMEAQGQLDQVWSIDYMLDVLPNGNRFWILNAVDDFSRECVFSCVFKRATAEGLVNALERQRMMGRKPLRLRSDNGGQFRSLVYAKWTQRNEVVRSYIRPSVSNDNAFVERFNRTLRQEVTDRFVVNGLEQAQAMIDDWRIRYNLSRPHHSLGGLSPMQFAYAAAIKRGVPYMPRFT